MDAIKITTSQNVALDYEAAGLGHRLLAALLDIIFMFVYIALILIILGVSGKLNLYFLSGKSYVLNTLVIIAFLPVLLYHFLSETFMNGQSPGKRIMGIRVVRLDGSQAGVGSFLLRSVFRIIDIHLFNGLVAIICIPVSEKSQRLGDMAAGTTVIKKNSKASLRDTILYREIPNYSIVFQQVSLLSDKDIAIIKEILEHSQRSQKLENLKPLAKKVKAKMGVEVSWKDADFLNTVLLDYSHYQFGN